MNINNFDVTTARLLWWNAFLLTFFLSSSCENRPNIEKEVEAIPVAIQLDRFDKKFHEGTAEDIPRLKAKYPYLFPSQFSDSVWIRRQTDSLQLLLKTAVDQQFSSTSGLENDLSHMFQHLRYHFPKINIPHTIAIINNVDYQSKSIYADTLLLVSLDTYLGKSHELYEGIPEYIRQEMDEKFILPHIAEKIAIQQLSLPESRSFLAQMVYYGKIELLKQQFLPHLTAGQRLGYSAAQYQWAQDNERYIWQYFIEKQLLYDTDPDLQRRFIDPAPFSKFYLEIDNESPAKIGRWLGAQIVASYWRQMEELSLTQLLETPPQILFNRSNYKPKR